MSKEKIIIGVLAGLAAGTLLGILFAPDEGSQIRKKISKKSSDTMDGLKEKFSDLMTDFNEKFEAAKEEAQSLIEKGKQEVKDLIKEPVNHKA